MAGGWSGSSVPDVRLHDLRRTVGSMLAQSGTSLLIIQKALGHSTPAATQVYARLGQDPVREALDQHGKRLMVAVGKGDAPKPSDHGGTQEP